MTHPALSNRLCRLKLGQQVQGFIQEATPDAIWISLAPSIRGRVLLLDAGSTPVELRKAAKGLDRNQPVACRVIAVDPTKHSLDLSMASEPAGGKTVSNATLAMEEGSVVNGKVIGVTPGVGLNIQLGPRATAKASIIDLHDTYVEAPLAPFKEGMFVRCKVLRAEGSIGSSGLKIDVSLRRSLGGAYEGMPDKKPRPNDEAPAVPDALVAAGLEPGQTVFGYVKSVGPKGLFVTVARGLVARVQLSHLADAPVADPAAQFALGSRVRARVLSVDSAAGRVELTLRSTAGLNKQWRALESLRIGEIVEGRVRKVEKYGVFVLIDNSALSGLAHISECADEFVKDLGSMFQPGERVRAKILSVENGRISLGLKPSYFEGGVIGAADESEEEDLEGEMAAHMGDEDEEADDVKEDASMDSESDGEEEFDLDAAAVAAEEDEDESSDEDDEMVDDSEDESDDDEEEEEEEPRDTRGVGAGPSKAAAAAKGMSSDDEDDDLGGLLKLGGRLDLGGTLEDAAAAAAAQAGEGPEAGASGAKLSKAAKKRQREAHEKAVREAERAKLEGNRAPKSAQDFEQHLLTSANSSYVWIRYMAFLLQLGETDK